MVYSPSYHECSVEYIRLTLHNPKDGSLIAYDIALAGVDDVDVAVLAAEKAFPSWRALAPQTHQNILFKFASLLDKHVDALGDLFASHEVDPNRSPSTKSAAERTRSITMQDGLTSSPESLSPQEDGFMKIVRNGPLGVTVGIVP
jgi:aldehyde dehydrogenase (NAD+)